MNINSKTHKTHIWGYYVVILNLLETKLPLIIISENKIISNLSPKPIYTWQVIFSSVQTLKLSEISLIVNYSRHTQMCLKIERITNCSFSGVIVTTPVYS